MSTRKVSRFDEFDGMGAELRGMQKELIKAVPLWMRLFWILSALASIAITVGLIALIVVLIKHFA
jgi:hypothetical protein